jgi:hypothetical protein
MQLSQSLHLIPNDRLFPGLRVAEEDTLGSCPGPAVALRRAYRFACRRLIRYGAFPSYPDLPARLRDPNEARQAEMFPCRHRRSRGTVTAKQYESVLRATTETLAEAAEMFIGLERFCQLALFPLDERLKGAQVDHYCKVVRDIDRRYSLTPLTPKQSPKPKRVRCPELNMEFGSASEASRYVSKQGERVVRRSDIRTAIAKHYRCGQVGGELLTWQYCVAERKPRVRVSKQRAEQNMKLFEAA